MYVFYCIVLSCGCVHVFVFCGVLSVDSDLGSSVVLSVGIFCDIYRPAQAALPAGLV